MANGDDHDENGSEDQEKAASVVRTAHQLKLDELNEQIELLKAEKKLQELQDQRDELERERREAPRERAQQEQALARERAREEKAARSKDRSARKEERKAEREDLREIQKLARKDRERMAAAVGAELEKTRVGELKLRDAPAGFEPEALREFSEKTSVYAFDDADLGNRPDADYFSLTEEEAADLYERIGANRGVVFDPTQDDVFHVGFRPVLRGPATESPLEDELRQQLVGLTEKLGRLEVEQTFLEREIGHWTPAIAGSGAKDQATGLAASALAAVQGLLSDAITRKESLQRALGTAVSWGQSTYETSLQQRIRDIEEADATIEIKVPPPGSVSPAASAVSQALLACRTHRQNLIAKIAQLETLAMEAKRGISRAPLLAYAQAIRSKVSEVEALERRVGQQAERQALESLRELAQRKRAVLEARLEAASKLEGFAAVRAEVQGGAAKTASPAGQTTNASEPLRRALVALDQQWVEIEAALRSNPVQPLEGLDALLELKAVVESTLEGQIEEQAKSLQKEIRSLTKEWVDALDKFKDGELGTLDSRIAKALESFQSQFATLETELASMTAASRVEQTRNERVKKLQKEILSTAKEWVESLDKSGLDKSRHEPRITKALDAFESQFTELQGALARATAGSQEDEDAPLKELRESILELTKEWVGALEKLGLDKLRPDPRVVKALDAFANQLTALEAELAQTKGAPQIDEVSNDRVQKLREEIRSLIKDWTETLEKLGLSKSHPDPRIAKALETFETQLKALETDLTEVKGTPRIAQVRALREDLAGLELEWRKALPDGAADVPWPRDADAARSEGRAIVKRELQRLLWKAVDDRSSRSSEQENQLRNDLQQAEGWCEELCAAKRVLEVAEDRRRLKQAEVDKTRSKLDSVRTALGEILSGRNSRSTAATLPARIYFRKPELDAKFENKFTASEIEAQAMSSGIDTTDFRVNSSFVSAFVSGGGGWGRSAEDSRMRGEASSSRKIYINSSFLLPKIELSLPLEQPCASDEFLAAVQGALAARSATDKVERLFHVLREFGQFVARRLTVGGKLYSTEERELTGSETASEIAKKRANEVQTSISVSTPWFGGGIEGKAAWAGSELDQETRKNLHEAQKLVLNVVGGEGGYAKNLAKWSESLQSYTRWQTIGMTDLRPSIEVLPDVEKDACIAILGEYVRTNHQVLASKRAAQFLFYSGYAERVGLRPTYFYLRNGQRVLSLPGNDDAGVFAVTAEPVRITDAGQLWTISEEGYVINQLQKDGVEVALTMKSDNTVVAVPPDPANEAQIWQIPHRGPITGREGVDAAKRLQRPVLKADASGKVSVDLLGSAATLTSYHQWIVVPREWMLATARKARVVYRSKGHIIELFLDHRGSWGFVPLTLNVTAPKAKGTPFAYATAFDGVPRVAYVGERGDVQELWFQTDRSWHHTDLASITRAPKAAGDVFGYVGGNTARVAYRDVDGYVRELYLVAGNAWHCADLTNGTVKARGNPVAYVTGTAATSWTPRVLFTDVSRDIREFRLDGSWKGRNLTENRTNKAEGDPFAYVSEGNTARVIYRDTDARLQEMYSSGGETWQFGGTLALNVDGDPVGFAGLDGKPRVIFRAKSGQLHLASVGTRWEEQSLTNQVPGAGTCAGKPVALVTSDRVTRVIYRTGSNGISELALTPGESDWKLTDLTALLGIATDWPPDSDPTGYAT